MSYHSIWECIGIEPTTDIPEIKKAFAIKSKEFHPEEHPEEFRELQQAYRSAVEYARMMKKREQASQQTDSAAEQSKAIIAAEKSNSKEQQVILPEKINLEKDQQSILEEPKKEEDQQSILEESKKEEDQPLIPEEPLQGRQVPLISEEEREEQVSSTGEFDFEVITDSIRSERTERFLTEFWAIAYNPYLFNHLMCWRFFLHQEEYQVLFTDAAFRKKAADCICSFKDWYQDTITYFEEFFLSFADGEDTDIRPELLALAELKKHAKKRKKSGTNRVVTKEQMELHKLIVVQVGKNGGNTNLERMSGVQGYLAIYLPYAAGQMDKLRKYDKQSRTMKKAQRVILTIAAVLVLIAVGVQLFVLHPWENKTNDKFLEERIENIRKYNEGAQTEQKIQDIEEVYPALDYEKEMDMILEDVIERYENWELEMETEEQEAND